MDVMSVYSNSYTQEPTDGYQTFGGAVVSEIDYSGNTILSSTTPNPGAGFQYQYFGAGFMDLSSMTNMHVDFYFEGTKYITFGSTAISAEVSRAAGFDRTQDTYLDAGDVNDLANMDYTISAWVKRNTGVGKFDVVSKPHIVS